MAVYVYPAYRFIFVVFATHILSALSQGLNPDFVKHLNDKVSHSLKEKISRHGDPWNDDDDGQNIIEGLAGAIKNFGKQRGKMTIDGRELDYETHYRLHSLDDGWVHDCRITDIATGVTVEVRHRKTEKRVIEEAVQKLYQELQAKGLVADSQGDAPEGDSSVEVDPSAGSPPSTNLPEADVATGTSSNPSEKGAASEDQSKDDAPHAEGMLDVTGSEGVPPQEEDKLSSADNTGPYAKFLSAITNGNSIGVEALFSNIALFALLFVSTMYTINIIKRKSRNFFKLDLYSPNASHDFKGSITRLLVDDIEPDDNGLYIHRTVNEARPTADQMNGIRNYDSMYRSQKKGLAYILNNNIFHLRKPGSPGRERRGSEIDLQNVQHLFTQLGYDVIVDEDATADRIRHNWDSLVRKINREGPEIHSSLVLFLMSHGTLNGILGTDELEVSIDEIMARLSGKNCKALVEKPKMVFVQACRGQKMQQSAVDGTFESSDSEEKPAEDVQKRRIDTDDSEAFPASASDRKQTLDVDYIPDNTDIYVAYATSYGYFSVRDKVKGSWFVQATCEEFIAGAHIDDVDTMLESVTRRVTQLWGKMKLRSGQEVTMLQTPDIRKQGVRRKIFFAPKYPPSGSNTR